MVVSLVVLVFLLHFQSALVIVLTLPVAVLFAFITMKLMGVSSNIMSLGGIAIAIGVLVDAGVIMVENCYRHLSEMPPEERNGEAAGSHHLIARQVGRAIFFSLAIIVLSFVPVFLLEGQEGKLFHPLAFTKTFSMMGIGVYRHHPGAGPDVLLHAGQDAAGERQSGFDVLHQALHPGHPLGAQVGRRPPSLLTSWPCWWPFRCSCPSAASSCPPWTKVAALHAGDASQRLHHRGETADPGAGHDHQERAGGGACARQGGAG